MRPKRTTINLVNKMILLKREGGGSNIFLQIKLFSKELYFCRCIFNALHDIYPSNSGNALSFSKVLTTPQLFTTLHEVYALLYPILHV